MRDPGANSSSANCVILVGDATTWASNGSWHEPGSRKLEIGGVQNTLDLYNLPSPAQYGLVVFVDDYTVVNGGAPYTDINQLAADFAFWNNFTASNQQTMGGNGNFT